MYIYCIIQDVFCMNGNEILPIPNYFPYFENGNFEMNLKSHKRFCYLPIVPQQQLGNMVKILENEWHMKTGAKYLDWKSEHIEKPKNQCGQLYEFNI